MVEEKEESILDTVTAAVEEQRSKAEPATSEPPKPPKPPKEPPPSEEQPEEEPQEEPVSEERAEPNDRRRNAQGRFEAKEARDEGDRPSEDKPEKPEEVVQDSKAADISRPPKRSGLGVKSNWLAIPEAARQDIWERERAVDTALKRYDGLGQYAATAERNGTNLPQVMQDYYGMEKALREDPIRGAITVWQRLGYNPEAVVGEFLRRAGNGQQPQGQQSSPIVPSWQDIEQRVEEKLSKREIAAKIAAFEADPKHHYLEPLIPGEVQGPIRATMIGLMTSVPGLAEDLEGAYIKACRAHGLDPVAPNGAADKGQTNSAAAVNRSRQAAKATIGAPSQGSNSGAKPPNDGDQSIYDTVRAAVKRQRGG